jgi:hypothetical protein
MIFAPSNKPPPEALARQSDFPRSITLASHSRFAVSTQLSAPPPMDGFSRVSFVGSMKQSSEWEFSVANLQLLPPGTHLPAAPDTEVHVSCFREVLGTQQAPLGTGRFPFCGSRTMTAAPETGERAASPTRVVKSVAANGICILDVGLAM